MKLVIFDCDGTLVDSQDAICGAMDLAFGSLGLAAPTRMQVLGVVGLSLPEAFMVLAPEHASDVRTRLADAYKSAFPKSAMDIASAASRGATIMHRDTLYDGARAAVDRLAARDDVVLGMATGKSMRGVQRLLDQEAWHSHFVTLQTADTHPSKPHPSMIETAMREAGIGPERTVIVGDTTYDIEMGRNAGVSTIGVSWGYHPIAHLEAAGAHGIIERFDHLDEAIERLIGAEGMTAR